MEDTYYYLVSFVSAISDTLDRPILICHFPRRLVKFVGISSQFDWLNVYLLSN